jgi:opacity protein-like surface antigen
MRQERHRAAAAVALTALLAALPAAAYADLTWSDVSGPYIGAGYGESKNQDIDNTGIGGGKDTDHAWKAFIGAEGSVLGFEVGYVDLGTTSNAIGSVDAKGGTAELLLSLPINPQFKLFAKGGAFYADVTSRVLGFERSDTTWEPTYGAGVGFNFNRNIGLRGEWERFDIRNNGAITSAVGNGDRDKIDLVSASLVLRFH